MAVIWTEPQAYKYGLDQRIIPVAFSRHMLATFNKSIEMMYYQSLVYVHPARFKVMCIYKDKYEHSEIEQH